MNRSDAFDALKALFPDIWNVPGTIGAMNALLDLVDEDADYTFPVSAIDAELLHVALPSRSASDLQPWVDPICKACVRFEINTIRRVAAFVTTLAHEGGFIEGREENMRYSAKRLSEVWPSRFGVNGFKGAPNALAKSIEGKPEQIANHVYAGRMGNGGPETGDGWRFRGVGPIQLTGRNNRTAFASEMGMSLDEGEAYIRTLEGGVMSAAWFWEENDINRLADTPGVSDETRKINGGDVGLAARKSIFDRLVKELLDRETTHG